MTVAELCHGRGTPPSAFEVTVGWPLYFKYHGMWLDYQRKQQDNTPQRTLK